MKNHLTFFWYRFYRLYRNSIVTNDKGDLLHLSTFRIVCVRRNRADQRLLNYLLQWSDGSDEGWIRLVNVAKFWLFGSVVWMHPFVACRGIHSFWSRLGRQITKWRPCCDRAECVTPAVCGRSRTLTFGSYALSFICRFMISDCIIDTADSKLQQLFSEMFHCNHRTPCAGNFIRKAW